LPGGLAVVSLTVCAVFTAFTGASGVTIVALGGLLLPAVLKDGYSRIQDKLFPNLIMYIQKTSSGYLPIFRL